MFGVSEGLIWSCVMCLVSFVVSVLVVFWLIGMVIEIVMYCFFVDL